MVDIINNKNKIKKINKKKVKRTSITFHGISYTSVELYNLSVRGKDLLINYCVQGVNFQLNPVNTIGVHFMNFPQRYRNLVPDKNLVRISAIFSLPLSHAILIIPEAAASLII